MVGNRIDVVAGYEQISHKNLRLMLVGDVDIRNWKSHKENLLIRAMLIACDELRLQAIVRQEHAAKLKKLQRMGFVDNGLIYDSVMATIKIALRPNRKAIM